MRLPSASGMERALACPPSLALPQIREVTPDATRGIAIHAFLEQAAKLGRERALEAVAKEHLAFCESIPMAKLPVKAGGFAAEVAFAYDPTTDTARELGRGIGREYQRHGLQPGEIPCTADVVGVGEGLVYVADWKTGFADVPAAGENWQIRTAALCATRAYGQDAALGAIVRLGPDGYAYTDEHTFDPMELDLARDVIRKSIPRWRRVHELAAEGAVPGVVTEGRWCTYCPAKKACPAVGLWLASVESYLTHPSPESLAAELTPERAAALRTRIEQVEDVLDLTKKALRLFARDAPIPLEGGKVWGPHMVTQEAIDAGVAYAVVGELAGAELARKAVEWSTTKTRLEDVARELPGSFAPTIAARKKKLLEAIEAKGGLTKKIGERFEAHRPKD